MNFISKRHLSVLYLNLLGIVKKGKPIHYDIEDPARRKTAYIQVSKRESSNTIDKDKMKEAFEEYLKRQKHEFQEYLSNLK